MFWGLIMEPNKRYSQTVQQSFHISMAAIDFQSAGNDPVQVMLSIEKSNYLLCTLSKDAMQTPLDLNFQEGDKISFMSNGKGHVHLTGYLVPEDDFMDEEDDDGLEEEASDSDEVPELVDLKGKKRKGDEKSSKKNKKVKTTADLLDAVNDDSEDDEDLTFNSAMLEDSDSDAGEEEEDDEDMDDDDDEAEDSDDEQEEGDSDDSSEEEEQQQTKKQKVQKKEILQNGTSSKKSPKDKMKENKKTKSEKKQAATSPVNEKQIKEKTPKKDTPKKDGGNVTPKGAKNQNQEKTPKVDKSPSVAQATPQKKTIEGGVHIEDLKVGTGPVAKQGKMMQVYYEGRLKSNNKVFDSTKEGAGFKFRLGKREVINGWDIGVAGMRVGGKRRITCPPNMAYGAKGSPPVIPPNSTLVFEVELKNVS